MELYTLTSRFLPKESVGEFTSAIWTERYSAAGDVQLVVPPVPSMIEKLTPGTFLGLRGTSEIMLLESQSIENNLLTVTGTSMPAYLNQRQAWFANAAYNGTDLTIPLTAERSEDTTAGQLISSVVYQTVIAPIAFGSYWAPINLDWTNDTIPGLALGWTDANGAIKRLSFPIGPLYDGLQRLAQDEGVGIKLYLESASYSAGFVFKFATYRGKDRTSEQTAHTMVRLTPKMDSLNDVKEISSVAAYKNVFYVNYKNAISTHYIPGLAVPTGFNRRAIVVDAPDIFLLPEHIAAFREQVARNTIANHVYIQAVDGRVSSKIPYTYGVDYGLGDVIELEGYTGVYSKARITEHIRSQDQYGEQEYPTLAVLDPLFIGYMPDLEPGDPDWPWETDPDYNYDIAPGADDPETKHKRRPKHPLDPIDRNPDPEPDFTPPPPNLGPFADPSDIKYMVTGYWPDQNNGEAISYLTFDGRLLPAWTYRTEDSEATSNRQDLMPLGWTLDHQKVIALSEDNKTSTEAYPWTRGYAFWLMGLDTTFTRLTDTITNTSRGEGLLGDAFSWSIPGVLWCGSEAKWNWYLSNISESHYPSEYLYNDGTYTLDGTATGHGDRIPNSGGPVELYAAFGGGSEGQATLPEMTRILFKEDFPPAMRWSSFQNVTPSPDGTKLSFHRQPSRPASSWILQGLGGALGGAFTMTVGVFGNLISGYFTTAPIPYNATADYIYAQLALIPYLQDPRLHGYPYTPYSLSSPLQAGGQFQFIFDVVPPAGVYIVTHSEGLSTFPTGQSYSISSDSFGEKGPSVWYLCDYNGANLREIDFGIAVNTVAHWSPDSTKLHAVVASASGDPLCRWLNYEVATGDISYPLDYTGGTLNADGTGPLIDVPIFSPDSQKIAWVVMAYDGTKSLWTANADGSNKLEIYRQLINDFSTDQNEIVLSSRARLVTWSFDGKKLAVVDHRDEASAWVIDLITHTKTKIWPGSGWDNPDDTKWLDDSQNFNG